MGKPKITVIQSGKPLNKLFKSNGEKESRANMTVGSFLKKEVESMKIFFEALEKLQQNQAITLGIPELEKGHIVTSKNEKEGFLSRTKKNFSFYTTAYLLFDYDPCEEGYEIKDPKHYVEVLRDIDPELKYCDIGVRYGSSYGIYKDGVLISDKKSMHAYIIVTNATNEKVTQYKDYLISEAWAKGYGHIELSKVGSAMRRQVFDVVVFSPERLVFEAAPTLEEGITRVVPKYEIFKGEEQ